MILFTATFEQNSRIRSGAVMQPKAGSKPGKMQRTAKQKAGSAKPASEHGTDTHQKERQGKLYHVNIKNQL